MTQSIAPVVGADYHLQGDTSDYHQRGSMRLGEWYGSGATELGYVGPVEAVQFRRAINGLSSNGDRSLVQVQIGKERQPGWDLTYSAPKSISVLWSRLDSVGRSLIEDIVLRAVKRAIDYIDVEALKTRRGSMGGYIESANGVYALFPHATSRALDPQLHVHAVAVNLCVRQDGTTGTIRSRDLYWHKMAAGALFRAELAHLLSSELGLSIVPHQWNFRIDGVSEALCREFSKRRLEIERLAKEEGWSSAKKMARLAVISRTAKRNVSLDECFVAWGEVSDAHGFSKDAAKALLDEGQRKVGKAAEAVVSSLQLARDHKQRRLVSAFMESVKALSAFKSRFPERDLVRETAIRAIECGASATEIIDVVKRGVQRFENRIDIKHSNYHSYSTKENIAAESELLKRAEDGRNATQHLVAEKQVLQAIAKCERSLSKRIGIPVELTKEQKAAIRHITVEPGNIKIVQGYAGTGKTQMLQPAVEAWKANGNCVIGTAITGRAALGLENTAGIPSVTIERLLRNLRPQMTVRESNKSLVWKAKAAIRAIYYEGKRAGRWMRNPLKEAIRESIEYITNSRKGEANRVRAIKQGLTAGTILVVDEAAMLPTATLLDLKRECDRANAKLVLVGDYLQLPPIEAGGPFKSLSSRIGHCALTNVVRQKHAWMREATALLIENQPEQALECYARNDALHIACHEQAAIEKLISDYAAIPAQKFASSIALTATNKEAGIINSGVQDKRRLCGQLGLSSAKLPNGERAYTGDRILFTRNDYRLDVRNGMLATLVGVSQTLGRLGAPSLTLRLDDHQHQSGIQPKCRTVTVDLSDYSDLQLGYAATSHKVQGVTVERSFVLLGDVMLSKERVFTQLTRASDAIKVYAAEACRDQSLRRIAEQLSSSTAKDLAHDHQVVRQPNLHVSERKLLLREAMKRVAGHEAIKQTNATAGLSEVKLAKTYTASLWLLVADLAKLRNAQFEANVAITAELWEAGRINQSLQQRRRAVKELGIDSVQLPNGERLYRGDRVLVTKDVHFPLPRSVLGTVVAVEWAGSGASDAKVSVAVDKQCCEGMASVISLTSRDFSKVQLGYAAAADALIGVDVDSSYVLLPEGGGYPRSLAATMGHASKEVAIYGEQAHYGKYFDAKENGRSIIDKLNSCNGSKATLTAVGVEVNSITGMQEQAETTSKLQRANDEQLNLSWEQSFTL